MWKYFFSRENLKIQWLYALGAPLYIFVFYTLLEPRKNDLITYNYTTLDHVYAFILNFTSITLMIFVIPKLFKSFFSIENWSFKKFNIWFICLVTLGSINSLFIDFNVFQLDFNSENLWKYFTEYQLPSDMFSILPLYVFFILNIGSTFNYTPTEQEVAAQTFNEGHTPSVSTIIFTDYNHKNSIQITSEQLLYITTSDNYVDIYYKIDNNVERCILRNTLKNIEEQCDKNPFIFRCHKTYIINTQKIKAIEGNTKGYNFILNDITEKIPISRQKNDIITERFKHFLL